MLNKIQKKLIKFDKSFKWFRWDNNKECLIKKDAFRQLLRNLSKLLTMREMWVRRLFIPQIRKMISILKSMIILRKTNQCRHAIFLFVDVGIRLGHLSQRNLLICFNLSRNSRVSRPKIPTNYMESKQP